MTGEYFRIALPLTQTVCDYFKILHHTNTAHRFKNISINLEMNVEH